MKTPNAYQNLKFIVFCLIAVSFLILPLENVYSDNGKMTTARGMKSPKKSELISTYQQAPAVRQIEISNGPEAYQPTGLTLLQPYADRIALGQTDLARDIPYEWKVNGVAVQSGTTTTTFLAHFDDNLVPETGEPYSVIAPTHFEPGKFNIGMAGKVQYTANRNLTFQEGTMELWLTFKEPLDSAVFDENTGDDKIFKYTNSDNGSYLMLRIKNYLSILQFVFYDGSGNWATGSLHLSTSYYDVPVNEPVYFALAFSKGKQVANFYMNGFKMARGKYDLPLLVDGESGQTFTLGNQNVVVDELRMTNKLLSNQEIKENYLRNLPFSKNDIYFTGEKRASDTIELSILGASPKKVTGTVKPPKINLVEPQGYIVRNAEAVDLSFTTPSVMKCVYGDKPDTLSRLSLRAVSQNGIAHAIHHPVTSTIDSHDFYVKCNGASGDPDDYSFYRRIRMLPSLENKGFPQLAAGLAGNMITADEAQLLSRYDVIRIPTASISQPTTLKAIRQLNPDIIIIPYKDSISNEITYDTWPWADFRDMLSDDWRPVTEDGSYAYNPSFPLMTLYNLYREVPFAKATVAHMENNVIARGYVDGISWDNAGSSLWFLYDYVNHRYPFMVDLDRDGVFEDLDNPTDLARDTQLWKEGMGELMALSRAAIGDEAIFIGNGSEEDHAGQYNGKHWEEWFDYNTADEFLRSLEGSYSFSFWQEHSRSPHLNWNLFVNNVEWDYKRMRYGLTGSLLGGVLFDPAPKDAMRSIVWYDEYRIDVITARPTQDASGKGYLGQPTDERSEVGSNVWRRDFDRGIVLFNNNYFSRTVSLGKYYRHIQGTQDPIANNGATVNSITLSGHDGRILLKPLCSDNPNNDNDCIEDGL